MARLTVSQAAEVLQISEDAVRKRIQRNTLAHGKFPDGRVYVYIDKKIHAKQVGNSATHGGTADQQRRYIWDYLLGLSAILTAIGVAAYLLGLLALTLPVWRTNTEDFTTAWYAASLAPRTLVAGLGVSQLTQVPLLITLAAVCVVCWRQHLTRKYDEERVRQIFKRLLIGGFTFYVLSVFGFLVTTIIFPNYDITQEWWTLAIGLIMGCASLFLIVLVIAGPNFLGTIFGGSL